MLSPIQNKLCRNPSDDATYPDPKAAAATARYPEASFNPMAKPRRRGPAKSIFMITVVDQHRPTAVR